jgi:RNA polymerase sigma-70 factor (ECF subfamily)
MQEPDDLHLRLRAGDERAFRTLVKRHHASLIGVALGFVNNRATAEEVVQDTWLAVIEGLDGFEGRSSLKNWIFAILANKARSRAVRDGRVVAAGSFMEGAEEDGEPVVDPSRFDSGGGWASPPVAWDDVTPERIVSGRQVLSHVADAIEKLPPAQRSVLMLREVEQMDSAEVSRLLGITDANQRVLLHRARAQIRDYMEHRLGE